MQPPPSYVQQRPLGLSSNRASVKRDSLPTDVVYEGWVEASTSRSSDHLTMAYWRLSRQSVAIYQNGVDPKARPQLEILLDDIINVEEDALFVFVIRTVGTILYVGSRQPVNRTPSQVQFLPQQTEQQHEYYVEWMSRLRTLWIPRIQKADHTYDNIHDFYTINPNDVLGQGQYGIVYTATDKKTGELVALKAIDYAQANFKQLSPETRIPKVLNHPGVIRILGLYYTREKIYIATERLQGDLLGFILDQPKKRLDERVTKFIAYQIISAVSFLNHYDVVHCDIKPENVLLVSENPFPQIKLCDFGYSRILNKGSVRRGSFVGTMNYLPPEAICRNPIFNNSLDTWACGVIVYVALSGVFPYNPQNDIKSQVSDDAIFFNPPAWREVTPQARDVVRKLMEISARKRGDCQRFKHHPWFTGDYQFWCDLKMLEESLTGADKKRWWTDDLNNGDETDIEEMRVAKGMPHWKEIGCKLAPSPPQPAGNTSNSPPTAGETAPKQRASSSSEAGGNSKNKADAK